jgi:dipeptidyl aminopeptidase/acylaminoacyl peptidase
MQSVRLSPDGRHLSFLGPDASGSTQLWIRLVDAEASARALTRVPAPGVRSYVWAENNRLIAYEHRLNNGWGLTGIELDSGRERPLVAMEGATFGNVMTRPGVPDEMLLSLRPPGAKEDDIYRLNVTTGALVLDTKNPGGIAGNAFFADHVLQVRAVQHNIGNGATEILVRDTPSDPWRSWLTHDQTYDLAVEAFTGDGKGLLLRSDFGTDKAQLVSRSIRDGSERVIAGAEDRDVEAILLHPRTGAVQAVAYLRDPRHWETIDKSLAADFAGIAKVGPGGIGIHSRDRADTRWVVSLSVDNGSRRLYLWNRKTAAATLILEEQPHLAALPLARAKPMSFTARDGLRFGGYLTLPVGVPAEKLPLVVWVHGGPYLRDSWGYDHIGQFFANRGYAFLRVNYRGSRGFGRRFRVLAFKQWGGTMQDDVVDATNAIVASGVADPKRMAILGHSYGGFVALAALTATPDLYACAAASSTTANLVAFIEPVPKTPGNAWFRETIGDPEDPKDLEMLKRVSPIFNMDRLSKPVLIARGSQDGALPRGDLDMFLEEAGKRGREAVLVTYEGDGHFFRRENELDYFARVEGLLARCLGGRVEPMAHEKLPGSTAVVKTVGPPRQCAAGRGHAGCRTSTLSNPDVLRTLETLWASLVPGAGAPPLGASGAWHGTGWAQMVDTPCKSAPSLCCWFQPTGVQAYWLTYNGYRYSLVVT